MKLSHKESSTQVEYSFTEAFLRQHRLFGVSLTEFVTKTGYHGEAETQ